jgi:hypothetical protein
MRHHFTRNLFWNSSSHHIHVTGPVAKASAYEHEVICK